MTPPIKVLVVDDSAFARKVLRQSLTADRRLEVVGIASDGLDALEKIGTLKPDVVTLDLVMPTLDGVGVLRELASLTERPAVVLVTISDQDSELTVEALQLGAVDLVRKPSALATDRLYELAGELVQKVVAAAQTHPRLELPAAPPPAALWSPRGPTHTSVLVVGTSTGGPQALTQLLSRLPANFPVPVAIALHIPGEYTQALAERLGQSCPLPVVEAHDGIRLEPGKVVLAKGGLHLTLARDTQGTFGRVGPRPLDKLYSPSVDVLFGSAAATHGAKALGLVLTGMGDDGLEGSKAIVKAGGRVFTEAEGSCVVYGMPRVVQEAGLSSRQARIEAMASEVVREL